MRWPERGWIRALAAFVLSLLGVAAVAVVAGPASSLGRILIGTWASVWLFLGGLAILQAVFSAEFAPLAVARTVLREAIRMRVAVAFIGLLLFLLAALPAMQSPDTPLRYRVQTFLSFGLGTTTLLLSLLTIFLACATLSGEMADKRIFTVMAKPIGRGAYLLGKWLGIVTLDALLLAVAGAAIYGLTHLTYLQENTPASVRDEVRHEVLTARKHLRPVAPDSLHRDVEQRLEALRKMGAPELKDLGEAQARKQLEEQVRKEWRTIAPRERETFVFEGLSALRAEGGELQLRYKLMTPRPTTAEQAPVGLTVNGREGVLHAKLNTHQVLRIRNPRELIGEDGRLEVVFANADPRTNQPAFPTPLLFPEDGGLEVLYEAGGFAPNLARALLMQWVRLGFLAMLGLAASTCLGFPVASLLTLAVFAVASASGFLLEAVSGFGHGASSESLEAAGAVVRWVGRGLAGFFSGFSRYQAGERVVDGRLVGWDEVLACAAWIGLLWTGLTAAAGWLVFRVRELGRVQV